MKKTSFLICAILHLGLGDDSLGDAILNGAGSALWTTGEAAVGMGGVVLNGLLQAPGAGTEVGKAVGNAAVNLFSGGGDTTADSGSASPAQDGSGSATVSPATDGSSSGTVSPGTDGSGNGAVTPPTDGADTYAVGLTTDNPNCNTKSLREDSDGVSDSACPANVIDTPIPVKKEDSNKTPDIEIDVYGDPVSLPKSISHDDCDSETSQVSLSCTKTDTWQVANPDVSFLQGSKNPDSCRAATARIVWPSDAGNTEQNSNVRTALIEKAKNPNDVVVSEDNGEMLLWSVPLTDEEVKELKTTVVGIKFIANDGALEMEGSSMAAKMIQKRAGNVVIQTGAPPHLEYISTPPYSDFRNGFTATDTPSIDNPPDQNSRYTYLDNAGEGIQGYWIDLYGPSFSNNAEFMTGEIIRNVLKALQPVGDRWDGINDYGKPGHALGMISLIAGHHFGVAKKGTVKLVQVVLRIASFLDALKQIRSELKASQGPRQRTRGYTVIGTGLTRAMDDIQELLLNLEVKKIILELINDFQAVIVTVAGNQVKPAYS